MSETNIGSKVRGLRESLQLTAEELAERSGAEVAMILSIEAGELVPSLAPLIQITRALGVRLGTLLDDDENLGPAIVRASDYSGNGMAQAAAFETQSDAGGLIFHALAEGKASRHMEPFYITLTPSETDEHKLDTHEGEEWLFALEGPLEIAYGKETYVLQPGDSIYYDTIVPHQVRSHNGQPAKFVACVYTPA